MMPDLTLAAGARTDTGRVRAHNEDAVLELTRVGDDDGGDLWLFAVADGVGGGPRGEVASRAAIESLVGSVGRRGRDDVATSLRRAASEANDAVYGLRRRFNGDRPASTLVVAAIDGDELWIVNVGDSRAYVCRRDSCDQITVDHSLAQDMLATGSARQARKYRHVITRSLGVAETVDADVFGPRRLSAGEAVVLCSDGLYGLVEDREIARYTSSMPPSDAAERLVELANERGGHDNVSVVIVQVVD